NFVLTIRELAKARSNLRVVNDQRGRPTDSRKLAEVSLALAERGSRGIFHVTDGGECTWFELAALIAGVVNPACQVDRARRLVRVTACSTSPRPRMSSDH
ncbi:MAG: sugar nucleotide-binding protein, partial [Deltaproteobacteria bacterium]|nr:sugar nucleotide-binding protein [Deltaproteobacteria bacterium]